MSGVPVELQPLREFAAFVLSSEGCGEETRLGLALVDDDRMAGLNETYRGVAGATDVLSFQMADELEPSYLGEVVMAPSQAGRHGLRAEGNIEDTLMLLVAHGILHLLGYGHEEEGEADKMFSRQEALLDLFLSKGGSGS